MGGKTEAPPAPDFRPILKAMDAMRSDQARAAEQSALNQERAVAESQNRAAQLGMSQANAAAMQDFMRKQQYQQMLDSLANQQHAAQASAMGHDIAGPAFDVNAATQAKLSGLGQIASGLPSTPYNLASYGTEQSSKPLNKFSMPDSSGLTFSLT